MTVKQDPKHLAIKLKDIQGMLEKIITEYIDSYADYGWDSFTEDIANVSAQIYKDEIMLKNAKSTRYDL